MRILGRHWAPFAAAVWTAAYLVLLILLVTSENGKLSLWYVAIVVVALGLLVAHLVKGDGRIYPLIAAIILAIASAIAGFSIGFLLLPAVVLALWAASVRKDYGQTKEVAPERR
jgi:hypothetical protein